jgi:hypothetical protein
MALFGPMASPFLPRFPARILEPQAAPPRASHLSERCAGWIMEMDHLNSKLPLIAQA